MSFLKLLALYIIWPVAGILPHAVIMKLANIAGHLLLHGKSAAIMKEEVGKMLGTGFTEEEIDNIVLEGLQNSQKDLFEIWSFPHMDKDKISRIVFFESMENIDRALSSGNGAVVGVTHFGSWKIIIAALAYAGYPTYQIAVDPKAFIEPNDKKYKSKIMEIERKCEDSLPAHFLYIDGFLRELYTAFRTNSLVLSSLDGVMRKDPAEMELLNAIIPVDKSAIRLAHRFDSHIIPVFPIRQADDRHRLFVHEPIAFNPEVEAEEAIDLAFNQYMEIFASYVEQYPSHYLRTLYRLAIDKTRLPPNIGERKDVSVGHGK